MEKPSRMPLAVTASILVIIVAAALFLWKTSSAASGPAAANRQAQELRAAPKQAPPISVPDDLDRGTGFKGQ